MTETPGRLGLRGRLANFESTLRLLGGSNATGAIAAGAAFHAFEKNADVQSAVKTAAVLFLFGIFTFVIGYAGLFLTTHDIDHSLHQKDEPTWPDRRGGPAAPPCSQNTHQRPPRTVSL